MAPAHDLKRGEKDAPCALRYDDANPFDGRTGCLTRPLSRSGKVPAQALIAQLCQMPIELAAPLLRSDMPDLTKEVLRAVVERNGPAHQAVIAARPHLSPEVIKALIRKASADAVVALIANTGARLDEEDREALFRLGRHNEVIRNALCMRSDTRAQMIRRGSVNEDASATLHAHNLRFLKAVRAGQLGRALDLAAPRLGVSVGALRTVLSAASPLPHLLIFRALELDKAIFIHTLPQWLEACEAAVRTDEVRHPVMMALYSLSPHSAAARLRSLCSHAERA